ncbi:hypothetical protein Gobs01_00448 [Geodermatophilus obscurus DSM 43160]
MQRLPWLLFGLQAGVLADRVDRRRLLIGVDLARGGVLVVLATALLTGDVGIAVVLAALFVLAVAEVFADTTSGTLLPTVVRRPDLGIGNARLTTGALVMNEMVGPALGAALFVAGTAWPFVTEAVLLALSAGLSPPPRWPARALRPWCRRPARRRRRPTPAAGRPFPGSCPCAPARIAGPGPAGLAAPEPAPAEVADLLHDPAGRRRGRGARHPLRRGAGGRGRRAVLGPLCLNCIRVVTLGRASRARRRRGGRWRGCGPRVGT